MKPHFKMTPDQLPSIAAFACVARHGSFTRAADELGLSPSALSQTVRKLERAAGVRLLARTTRRVAATEAGARFLAAVVPGLTALTAACEGLLEEGETPRGTVRLCLSRVAFTMLIAPHLAAFARDYPEVQVEIGLNDGLSDLIEDRFDLGVRLDERLAQDMVAVPVGGEQRLEIVGSPAYFARHPRPREPAELLTHDCIRLRFVTSGRLFPWTLTCDGKDLDVDVQGRLIVNDMVPMVEAARDGLGLAQVFAGLARAYVTEKLLIPVLREYSAPFRGFYFYYPSRAHLPLRVRAFLDFFQRANRQPP